MRRPAPAVDLSRVRTLVHVRCGAENGRCGRLVAEVVAVPGGEPFLLNRPTRKGAEPVSPRCPTHGPRAVERAALEAAIQHSQGRAGPSAVLV